MSADSSGNGHRLNTSRPSIPRGHFRGFKDSQIQKSGEAVKRLDRLASNLVRLRIRLGMDIGSIQFASQYPNGHFGGGGIMRSQIKIWESCQTAEPIGTKFGTRMWIHFRIGIGLK